MLEISFFSLLIFLLTNPKCEASIQASFPIFQYSQIFSRGIPVLNCTLVNQCSQEFGILFHSSNSLYFWNRKSYLRTNSIFRCGVREEEEQEIALKIIHLMLLQMDLAFPPTSHLSIGIQEAESFEEWNYFQVEQEDVELINSLENLSVR